MQTAPCLHTQLLVPDRSTGASVGPLYAALQTVTNTIRKPCTVNQRVLHSFIYGLRQHWTGLCGQDSHGYETCKVHLLPQQHSSWYGLSQTHSYRVTIKNKIFGSVTIITAEQYAVLQFPQSPSHWPWEEVKWLDLLWFLFPMTYSQNRSTKLSCSPLCCYSLLESEESSLMAPAWDAYKTCLYMFL